MEQNSQGPLLTAGEALGATYTLEKKEEAMSAGLAAPAAGGGSGTDGSREGR
jgi:hypothetical protein